MPLWLYFVLVGLAVGSIAGMLGIGGGVLVIPALVFLFGFSQKVAVGTSLAMLLPPIGIFALMPYWRDGNVRLGPAMLLAAGFAAGGLLEIGRASGRERVWCGVGGAVV